MARIRWKLREYIEAQRLRPRDVENEAIRLGHSFGRNTIYRLLKDDGPENLSRTTLVVLVESLRSLTRRKVKLSDLIEYED